MLPYPVGRLYHYLSRRTSVPLSISFKWMISILRPRWTKYGQRNNAVKLVLSRNGTDAVIGDEQRRPQSEENRRSGNKPSVSAVAVEI